MLWWFAWFSEFFLVFDVLIFVVLTISQTNNGIERSELAGSKTTKRNSSKLNVFLLKLRVGKAWSSKSKSWFIKLCDKLGLTKHQEVSDFSYLLEISFWFQFGFLLPLRLSLFLSRMQITPKRNATRALLFWQSQIQFKFEEIL